MPLIPLLILAATPALAEPVAPPSRVVVHIDGMVCNGCQESVTAALDALPFVASTTASFAVGGACVDLSAEGDTERIREAVSGLGYTVTTIEAVDACPAKLKRGHRVDPWDDTGGHDVVVISRGAEVTLEDHLAEDKFTVVDFGAPWCGPCHTTAATLRTYMDEHDDVAVRVVTLDASDPRESYALPVVEQHIKWVGGIPYFLVYDPTGKTVYKGSEVDAAIKAIDKRRSRQ